MKNIDSEHIALGLTLNICHWVGHNESTASIRVFHINDDKKQAYVDKLNSLVEHMNRNTWADLQDAMLSAVVELFRKPKSGHKHLKELPCKKWFDDECKAAHKALKKLPKGQERRETEAQFNALTCRK